MCGDHQSLLLLYILQSCYECKCSDFSIIRSCWHLHFVELDNQQGRIVIFHLSCLLILCTNVDWSHCFLFSYMHSILYSSVSLLIKKHKFRIMTSLTLLSALFMSLHVV